jgi:hypothetical protein
MDIVKTEKTTAPPLACTPLVSSWSESKISNMAAGFLDSVIQPRSLNHVGNVEAAEAWELRRYRLLPTILPLWIGRHTYAMLEIRVEFWTMPQETIRVQFGINQY